MLARQSTGLFFSVFLLTDTGTGLGQELSDVLDEGEGPMEEWLHNDLRKAKLFLPLMGTKVLLLPNLLPHVRDAKNALAGEPLAGGGWRLIQPDACG